jgi:hypothetical protein
MQLSLDLGLEEPTVQPAPETPALPELSLEEANRIFNGTTQLAIGLGHEEITDAGLYYVLRTDIFNIEYYGSADKLVISLPDGTVVFNATATIDGVQTYRWRQLGWAWRRTLGSVVRSLRTAQ